MQVMKEVNSERQVCFNHRIHPVTHQSGYVFSYHTVAVIHQINGRRREHCRGESRTTSCPNMAQYLYCVSKCLVRTNAALNYSVTSSGDAN
jgi:hypothetical protein